MGEHLETDEAVVLDVQQGNAEKFGIVMERYQAKLFRYGRKFLSDPENISDLVQDVFIKSYQAIQSFDTSQKFSSWIYRIAHNSFVNELKRKQKAPLRIFDFDTLLNHPVYEEEHSSEEQVAIKNMIDIGLNKLDPKYKEVLILHFIEDLAYKDISDVLRVPTSTVGVRIKRAKEALKKVCDITNI